ncbi:MAG: M48 family metalloprotease [Candidatus Sungbacteria bacterium]|nr:M48 family metalloprotease [Candidatus Sungbacteria bacterium]
MAPAESEIIRWRVFLIVARAWLALIIALALLTLLLVNIVSVTKLSSAYAWLAGCIIFLHHAKCIIAERIGLSRYSRNIPEKIMAEFRYVKEKSGISYSIPIYMKPDSVARAAIYGFGIPYISAVTVSTGICNITPHEWRGVFAHEFAHIKIMNSYGILSLTLLIKLLSIYCGIFWVTEILEFYDDYALATVCAIIFLYYINPLLLAVLNYGISFPINRRFEYAADAFGAYILGSADHVIDVLKIFKKINHGGGAENSPGFIPAEITHPSLDKRISALEKLKTKPS